MSAQSLVFVHGFWDNHKIFSRMSKHLKSKNYKTYDGLDLLPGNGKYGLEKLAEQLKNYIESNIPENENFSIVAFSMGGIVSRHYLQNMDGIKRVNKLITISSPHHGTWIAHLFNHLSCVQMRPGSIFLNALNEDIAKLSGIDITSIWARYDTTIVPNRSSRLPIGNEVILPFGIHPLMPYSKKVIMEVEKTLKS